MGDARHEAPIELDDWGDEHKLKAIPNQAARETLKNAAGYILDPAETALLIMQAREHVGLTAEEYEIIIPQS